MNWATVTWRELIQHVRSKNGYTITKNHRGEYAITCHKCDRVSYHPEDVSHRYCGHCHVFHDEKGQK